MTGRCLTLNYRRGLSEGMSDAQAFREAVSPFAAPLCHIGGEVGEYTFGITETQLKWLDRATEDDVCPVCFVRLADLKSMLELLGEKP